MPLCKICASEYDIEASVAHETAPGWDGECSACTRRRFETYVNDYLLENFTVKEFALRAEGYFNTTNGTIIDLGEKDLVARFVTTSVLDQSLGMGGGLCSTPGEAIGQFVDYFDKRLMHLEKALSARAKGTVSKMCVAGAIVIGIVVLLLLLTSYLIGVRF